MIRSIFVVSDRGDILIEKHWRGFLNRSIIDCFLNEVLTCNIVENVPPVIPSSEFFLIHSHCGDLFFICPVKGDVPPLLVTEFLHRFTNLMKEYFGSVSEQVVKENFVTIYQLLDEVMDSGIPFNTVPNLLRAMVPPPSIIPWSQNKNVDLPTEISSSIPWRHSMKYTNNEIFFDIFEELDAIIDLNGMVISSSVYGIVKVQCKLSGMPDLALRWTNPRLLDDASFHPCVRYSRFEMDKTVSFVPPDGDFVLMKYRIFQTIQPPMYCKPSFNFGETGGRVNIMVGPKNCGDKTVENVVVTIPMPACVNSHSFEANVGTTSYDDKTKMFKWHIPKLTNDKVPMLEGNMTLNSGVPPPDSNPTVRVDFYVKGFAVSGIKVDNLALLNEAYKPFKGVKFHTKAGKFEIRC